MEEAKYRHELKYLCTIQDIIIIKSRLQNLMSLDNNAKQDEQYTIRSVYFDDYKNTCFYENENGIDPREKFRIRIYNQSSEQIHLECKRKENGKTLKESCYITKEEALQLMNSKPLEIAENTPALVKKLNLFILTRHFKPAVIVEYDRIPFVYPLGNVRVTLDMNIASSKNYTHMFDNISDKRLILPTGYHILEVKYDEYIPDYIKSTLQLGTLKQTAFSKYYLCRKYSL